MKAQPEEEPPNVKSANKSPKLSPTAAVPIVAQAVAEQKTEISNRVGSDNEDEHTQVHIK